MIPLPTHPEIRTYRWTALELRAIEQWGREVEAAARRQALEDAARECEDEAEPGMALIVGVTDACAHAIRSLIDKDATPSASDHAPGEAQPAPIPGRLP